MSALTKIFIVLQLVCSLVVAVVLVVALKGQTPYKATVESERASRIAAEAAAAKLKGDSAAITAERNKISEELRAARGDSDRRIGDLTSQKATLEAQVDTLKSSMGVEGIRITQLTSAIDTATKENTRLHSEIERIAPENSKLIQQNAELSRANNELITQLRYAEQTIRKQKEVIVSMETKGGAGAIAPTDSGTVATLTQQTPAQINGKVTRTDVSAGRQLLEIGLGSRDGIKVGTQVMVSRNGAFIADAVIEKVTPEASVAATTSNVKKGETVKAGDLITVGNPQ